MYYLYVLKSLVDERLYIGSTNDLRKRFAEHNKRQNISTKNRAPFKLVYYEAYDSKIDCLDRERKLKQHIDIAGMNIGVTSI